MPKSKRVNKPYPPYASLCLRGKGLDPQKITNLLGLEPDKSFKRGEIRNTDQRKWPHGLWMLDSSQHIRSLNLLLHLDWLLEQAERKQTKIGKILDDAAVDAEINCFWIMPSSHEELVFEPELLRRIAKLGIRLGLDMYCPDH